MNKKVIYFLKRQVILIMEIKFFLYSILILIFSFNSYTKILYQKNNIIITDIDLKIYKKFYMENYGNDINQANAIKDLVLIQNVVTNLENNNSLFIEKIDYELSMQFGKKILDDQNLKKFLRFSKIRDEFIINYFRNVLEVNEIKKVFESLDNLNLPVSDNNCLLINKIINLQHNMDFIENFYNSLKNDSSNFTVTINKNEYKVCIDEKIFKNIEKLIVDYIQMQTKDEFEKFVYEKTYN